MNQLITQEANTDVVVNAPRAIVPVLPTINVPPTLRYINALKAQSSKKTMSNTLDLFTRELCAFYNENSPEATQELLIDSHVELPWSIVDDYSVSMTLNRLNAKGLHSNRVNTYISAIKRSADFAYNMKLISSDVLMSIKAIKPDSAFRVKKGRPLEKEEVKTLFYPNPSSATELRDNALFALLTGCGLRCSEMMTVSLDDFFEKKGERWLSVIGKGNKQRHIPISDDTYHHIQAWKRLRQSFPLDGRTLIVRIFRGGHLADMPLTSRTSVYNIVRTRCSKALNFPISPHDLRRTLATILFHSNVDISIIQDLLGHSNVEVTKRYITKDPQIFTDAMKNVKLR